MSRPYVFRAKTPPTDWLRDDLEEVVIEDRPTAFLLWLIYTGARVPFTVSRPDPSPERTAA